MFFLTNKSYCRKQKAYHNCGGKEKAGEYYLAKKDALKEKGQNNYNLLEEEKEAKENIIEISRKISQMSAKEMWY